MTPELLNDRLIPEYGSPILSRMVTTSSFGICCRRYFSTSSASRAVSSTMLVVSRWKMVPEGGDDVTVTELHISVAVTDQPTGTLVLQVTMTIFDGQVMTGGVVRSEERR